MALSDRALLLLGSARAFGRSELIGLDVVDVEDVHEGFRVIIRRGKTDQKSRGAVVSIVRRDMACPVFGDQVGASAERCVDRPRAWALPAESRHDSRVYLVTRPLLAQRDGTTLIVTYDVKRVLTDIDANNGD